MGVEAKIKPPVDKSKLRGVRVNNPGNIDYNPANKWQGRLPHDPSIEKRFERFETPQMGIRALAVLLVNYYDKHNLFTINGIIGRYAPPGENKTHLYAEFVADRMDVSARQPLDLHQYETLRPLVEAIIAYENAGYAYPRAVVDAGLALAGIKPKASVVTVEQKKPVLLESGTWERAAQGAGALFTVEGVRELKESLDAAKALKESAAAVEPSFALYAGFVLLAVAFAAGVYRIVRKRRELSIKTRPPKDEVAT